MSPSNPPEDPEVEEIRQFFKTMDLLPLLTEFLENELYYGDPWGTPRDPNT